MTREEKIRKEGMHLMPYRIKECAGKPYRPSNGTEGEMFQAEFCSRCMAEREYRQRQENGCNILMNTMCNNVDEEGYPPEWTHNDEGEPICTAFERDWEEA